MNRTTSLANKWNFTRGLTLLFCGALLFAKPASASMTEPTAPRNIQILLEKDAPHVLLEVKGPYTLLNPQDGSRIASGLLGKRFLVHELETGLKWGEEFVGIHQMYLQPKSKETTLFVNGIQYPGAVAIFGVQGNIHVVNDLSIESFVQADLTAKCSPALEPEVLSALAIISRTNAYYQATRSEESFWHVAAKDISYLGSGLVAPNSPITKAVESTKNLILVHLDHGQHLPFAAAWTEHSAGKTASFEAMFRKDVLAPKKGVDAPHAALAREESRWSYLTSKKHLCKVLDIENIDSVEPFLDAEAKKVYGLRIHTGKETHDVDFFTLQNLLGKEHLQSSDFTVQIQKEGLLFEGFGRGHGVGLCLYSATALAQNGENAVKILAKFFPETFLYNIDTAPLAK